MRLDVHAIPQDSPAAVAQTDPQIAELQVRPPAVVRRPIAAHPQGDARLLIEAGLTEVREKGIHERPQAPPMALIVEHDPCPGRLQIPEHR
jgi:hypothetical protein